MDEAAVQNIVQQSNNALIAQITELISFNISSLKRSSEASSEEQLKEIKKLKTSETHSFKKKSNEEQFKATKNVLNTIEDATFETPKNPSTKVKLYSRNAKN